MTRALTGLRTAVAALTVVPMGRFDPDPPAAVRWYPWVGWVFAIAAVGIVSTASLVVDDPLGSLLVGTIVVAAWAGLSGLMHWDGLADTADGLLGGHTPERRLEIMADGSVGAFGSVTVTLVVLAQVVCVAVLFASRDWWAIGAAPIVGRFAATLCASVRGPARVEGLGASAASRFSAGALAFAFAAVALTLAGVVTGTPAATVLSAKHGVIVLAGVAAGAVASIGLTRPVGGYTGDILGASIVCVETALLLVAAVWHIVATGWPV